MSLEGGLELKIKDRLKFQEVSSFSLLAKGGFCW